MFCISRQCSVRIKKYDGLCRTRAYPGNIGRVPANYIISFNLGHVHFQFKQYCNIETRISIDTQMSKTNTCQQYILIEFGRHIYLIFETTLYLHIQVDILMSEKNLIQ